MKKRIVIITDCTDIAYNELRATILKNLTENQEEVEIEPIVPVAPFSILNGNFIFRLIAESYPNDTLFLIVLNPLKERPARLIGRTEKNNFYFMGANTGVFTWFLRDFGIKELYELKDPGFFPFGGKYVHAPSMAQIINGKPLHEIGIPFDVKNLAQIQINDGTIVHIDNFGLMKFTGDLSDLAEGDKLIVDINGKNIQAVYAKRMMSKETGEWVLYPGSSFGLPELGLVRKNGAQELNVKIGDKIVFKRI